MTSQKIDQRRWEDLDVDCLMNVLGRVGMESLLLGVPFVCKSWYKASLDPSFWQCLILPEFHFGVNVARFSYCYIKTRSWIVTPFYRKFIRQYRISKICFSMTGFVKLVVSRSRGNATSLSLPECSNRILRLVANTCPGLKALSLPSELVFLQPSMIIQLIEKLENLESLSLKSGINIALLSPISLHCNNFRRLEIHGASVGEDAALSIVKLVPNIEHLSLRRASIPRGSLITILRGCKKLVCLDVSGCIGFDAGDEEISKFASHITHFSCQGSRPRL